MDMDIVMTLAMFTIGAALVIGVFSYFQARKAQKNHEGAAAEEGAVRREQDKPVPLGEEWSEERANNPPTSPMPPKE